MAGFIGNLGEFGMRTGDWDEALIELDAAQAETWEGFDRVSILSAAVGLRASRGEAVDDGLAEVSLLADTADDPQARSAGAMTTAMVAFARGDLALARGEWQRAGGMVVGQVPWVRARGARAALWMADVAGAIEDLGAVDRSGFHGPALEADRATIRAGIAALEGRASDALNLYREALAVWRDLGLTWDEALCGLDMALLLDPADSEVRAAADRARETFTRLEAAPFAARLAAAMERASDRSNRRSDHGVTPVDASVSTH